MRTTKHKNQLTGDIYTVASKPPMHLGSNSPPSINTAFIKTDVRIKKPTHPGVPRWANWWFSPDKKLDQSKIPDNKGDIVCK